MNMKKIISSVAAVAMAASLMAVAANATNWSAASYADNDPNTVSIISTSEDISFSYVGRTAIQTFVAC